MKISRTIYAVATLSGTIIGAGIFTLPYITSRVGLWIMLGYFFLLGGVVILIHQFFGELALRTPDYKRLPGFAKLYLGDWGERVASASTVITLLGTMLAYLIVGGQFLSSLFPPLLKMGNGGNLFGTLIYFLAGAILIFFGIKMISRIEFWSLIGFFLVLLLIFLRAGNMINIGNLTASRPLGMGNLFLPYGAVLFSLWGASLVPEIEEMLFGKKKLLKTVIPVSIFIPVLIYLFFIYLVLGISGSQTSQSAITGLGAFLSRDIFSLLLLFGLLTTFTSLVTLGLTLKKVFWYDMGIGKNWAWLITCFVPLALFFAGINQFIPVVSFIGAMMGGINGIIILLMYRKIKPQQFLVYPLALIMFGGIIYELVYFIGLWT